MQKIDPITRRELLAGLGIAAGEILLMRSSVLASLLNPSLPTVVVSEPTGAAIQAAINKLGTGGGNIYLSARIPYVINQTLVILNNNINLVGRGPRVTRLIAQSGAVLTVPYQCCNEYLLLVQNAANVTILGLTVDTANEANSPGWSRDGIGVWNSTSVLVSRVSFVNNLGPSGQNTSLTLNQSSYLTVDRCDVAQSRMGIFLWECTNFTVSACGVHDCAVKPPDYPLAGAIGITDCTTGLLTSCSVYRNTVYNGIWVISSAGLQVTSCRVYKTLPFPTQPGNDGITFETCSGAQNVVQGCEVVENSGSGVSSDTSSNLVIQNCNIVQSGTVIAGGSGVSLNGGVQGAQIMNNQVTNSQNSKNPGIVGGFFDSPDGNSVIANNVVSGFAYGVGLGSNSSGFQVEDNDLRLNTVCVENFGTDNVFTDNLCP